MTHDWFKHSAAEEMEALIEALNEASLDPYTRARLAADPMQTLREMQVHVPDHVVVEAGRDRSGNVRLTITSTAPTELDDDVLDAIVGGAAGSGGLCLTIDLGPLTSAA